MDYQLLAAQLRKPHGDFGMEVTGKMNATNVYINRRAIDLLNINVGEKVLEIGMANGFFCEEIIRTRQAFYTGCDFSELMVREAEKLNAGRIESSQAKFHLADASNLPFPDKTFDKVFTVNTLYFWQNPVQELSEIKRVMKPSAKLVLGIRSKETMLHLPMVQYGFTLYQQEELHALLIKVFQQVKVLVEDEPVTTVEGNTIYFQSLFAIVS